MDSYFVFFIDSTQFSFLPFDFLSFVEGLKEDEDCDNFSNFNISFSMENLSCWFKEVFFT